MAGFVEPRNGRYRARFIPPGGSEVNETFDRKGDAEDWLDEQRGQAVRGTWIDPRGGKTLFGDNARVWATDRVHVRESTGANEERMLRLHILPTFENRQLRAISRRGVQSWVTAQVKEGLAPSTIEGNYKLLSMVMRAAVLDKLIAESPCRGINLPAVSSKLTIPTLRQLELAAGRLPASYRRFVPVKSGTGLRGGELFGLTEDRINFLRGTIRVDRQRQRLPKLGAYYAEHGKLPKGVRAVPLGGSIFLTDLKTENSDRVVPVGRHTLDVLAAQIAEFPPTGVGLVFTNAGGRPVTREALNDAWERVTRARSVLDPQKADPAEAHRSRDPDLEPYFTPHDMRHFYASLLIAKGVPVTRVAACLGDTEEIVLRTYAHLWPGDDHRVREAVDDVFLDNEAPAMESRPQHGLG